MITITTTDYSEKVSHFSEKVKTSFEMYNNYSEKLDCINPRHGQKIHRSKLFNLFSSQCNLDGLDVINTLALLGQHSSNK